MDRKYLEKQFSIGPKINQQKELETGMLSSKKKKNENILEMNTTLKDLKINKTKYC